MPTEDMDRFDEDYYLKVNPDVAAAVHARAYPTGLDHYLESGFRENRYKRHDELKLENTFTAERVIISAAGFLFISGWINDFSHPLDEVWISSGPYRIRLSSSEIYRYKRDDVEEAFELSILKQSYDYGFFCLLRVGRPELLSFGLTLTIVRPGIQFAKDFQVSMTTDEALCLHAMTFINSLQFKGDHLYHLFKIFDQGFGATIREVYDLKNVTHRNYTVSSFNERKTRCSVITVLFGMHSPVRMIGSTAVGLAGDDFEWIFVNNSPELAHQVIQSARIVAGLYNASVKVINFNGNVGFGLANNVAAQHASGDIICIYNPDIVPIDKTAFDRILQCSGEKLFGAVLYYADGTVMHNGMTFYIDKIYPGRSINGGAQYYSAVRVEHYDKGAPAAFARRDRNHELVAVSGALMVCTAKCFNEIGGFEEKFIFGHYEDANLCLRWREKFGEASVQIDYDMHFIHLESKGSHGDKEPYRGAAKLNRWLFSNDPVVLDNAIY